MVMRPPRIHPGTAATTSIWFVVLATLVILKVTGAINWSWVYVVAPIWAPIAVAAALVLLGFFLILTLLLIRVFMRAFFLYVLRKNNKE